MIVTDVYVSFDDITYRKIDLFKNEPISIKHTSKDLTDITKTFLPYSLTFTVPSSDVNKSVLDWFGYSKSLKQVSEYKFFCKIYTNHSLSFKGLLKVTTSQFEDKKAKQYNVSFATTTTDLKALIGDETLQDLASLDISFSPKNVENLLVSGDNQTVNGVNVSYFIPFVSNNRVWSYENESDSELLDNIAYKSSLSATNERLINYLELRPAIHLKSLFELIINKYNLDVLCPFFNTPEFATMNMWCNENYSSDSRSKLLVLNKQYSNESPTLHGRTIVNFTDNSIKILKAPQTRLVRYRVTFNGVYIGTENVSCKITLRRKSDNLDVLNFQEELQNGNNQIEFSIPIGLFQSNEFEFFTIIQFSNVVTYTHNSSRVLYRNNISDKISSYDNNNTLLASGFQNLDIFKMLPKMKVIDFITSFTKSFNISIVNNNPKETLLYWLRKQDIDTNGLEYSKNTLDYTPYLTDNKVVKSIPADYNSYSFKHANSKYFSNVNFKKQFSVDYGQVKYPLIDPPNKKEMKIETGFSIIAPVTVQGYNLITAYGFTDANPRIITSGASRYTPNYGEPTLFHRLNTATLPINIGIQSQDLSGNLINKSINTVNRVAPFSSSNFSLSFSNIIFQNVEFVQSLFQRYYSTDIVRLTNPRNKICNFNLTLPANEIDINQYTKVNQTSLTPTGFRIQNDILIEETKYSIIDATMDLTTGKTKIQLLNY